MLKMYSQVEHSGATAQYWDDLWKQGDFEYMIRFCEIGPLARLFDRYVPSGSWMLEGGCGMGHFAECYARKGVNVVGADFATETLCDLRQRARGLRLCTADISQLPFRDGVFDSYYSGGVVEHIETGPMQALREAHRILKPGGIFLVSIPYFSPLRKLLWRFRADWRRAAFETKDDGAGFRNGYSFVQYAYTVRDFRRPLEEAGFRIIGKKGYSILWGMYDLPFVEKAVNALMERRRSGGLGRSKSATGGSPAGVSPVKNGSLVQLLKRLAVSEDVTVPIAGWFLRILRWGCSNMMMFVCVRD